MQRAPKSKGLILLETSVLISFVKIQRLDILSLLDRDLCITEEVDSEINGAKYPFQRQHLDSHLQQYTLTVLKLEDPATLLVKSHMRGLGAFGTGECSTAAKALELAVPLAMTDKDAITGFLKHYPALRILTVLDLMREILTEKKMTLAAADLVLPSWAKEAQNPVPTIKSSFAECLGL